jgi:RNA polymerase sigma-70 factor (ECF subfamily)
MRKFEGLSQREVARKLDIPEHTVENDVAKALRLIQQAIAQGENEAETSLERTTKHGRARLSTGSQ